MKRVAIAVLSGVAINAIVILGCVPEKKKTQVSLSLMEQNALEAEQAEQEIAEIEKARIESEKLAKNSSSKSGAKPDKQAERHSDKQAEKQSDKHSDKQARTHEQDAVTAHKIEAKPPSAIPAKPAKTNLAKAASTALPTSSQFQKTAHVTSRKPASTANAFTVRVGAFRVKENAERMHARLQQEGFKSTLRLLNHSKNGQLYLVHLEPTTDRGQADAWSQQLKSKSIESHITAR